MLKVFQSVDDKEPVADVPAKPKDNCWPERDRPLAGEPRVTSPVLVPDVVALPAKAKVYPPPTIVALLMVEVEMFEVMILLAPVKAVLPPWRDRVLEFKVSVPVPVTGEFDTVNSVGSESPTLVTVPPPLAVTAPSCPVVVSITTVFGEPVRVTPLMPAM